MTGRAREGAVYSLGTLMIAAVVLAIGGSMTGGGAMAELVCGSIVAAGLQIVIYWAFFVVALPGREAVAHGLGVMVRMMAVAAMAFVGAPALGLSLAPTLLSMVGCLFGSTLLEAVILQRRVVVKANPGAVTMR